MNKIPECPKCKLPEIMCECDIELIAISENKKLRKGKMPSIQWHLILPRFINERGLKVQCDSAKDASRFEKSLISQQANKRVLWLKQLPPFLTFVDSTNKLYIVWDRKETK